MPRFKVWVCRICGKRSGSERAKDFHRLYCQPLFDPEIFDMLAGQIDNGVTHGFSPEREVDEQSAH